MNDIMWWGYLHQNGTVQVKRWFGDHKDYTEDCEGNDFVQHVVPPFYASTSGAALETIMQHIRQHKNSNDMKTDYETLVRIDLYNTKTNIVIEVNTQLLSRILNRDVTKSASQPTTEPSLDTGNASVSK